MPAFRSEKKRTHPVDNRREGPGNWMQPLPTDEVLASYRKHRMPPHSYLWGKLERPRSNLVIN